MPLGSIVIVGHGLKSQWVKSLLITFSAAQSDDTWNIEISEYQNAKHNRKPAFWGSVLQATHLAVPSR